MNMEVENGIMKMDTELITGLIGKEISIARQLMVMDITMLISVKQQIGMNNTLMEMVISDNSFLLNFSVLFLSLNLPSFGTVKENI